MCGICGVFGPPTAAAVSAMVAALRHRGPDDQGTFRDAAVELGHARLSIIDVSPRAHQPMSTADGTVWIVYNGEDYDFAEQRACLEALGHRFFSTSDTEVVLRLYEQYGDSFPEHLRGIFACAIYDRRRGPGAERLVLARDHLGVKPLLWARAGERLVFASELKALLASGLVEHQIDPEALRLLLTHGSVPQPLTLVRGVRMLPAGHRMIVERGHERLEPYWRLDTDREPGLRERPYPEQVERVRAELERVVKLQMVSDVPVGAFLSGGIDSSTVVALLTRAMGRRVRTFSVGFEREGAALDESDGARIVSEFIGTDHQRVVVTGRDVRERIEAVVRALDQPSVDGVNSYFVSSAAAAEVKVAVSGTGGDELFAGYPWFREMAAWSRRSSSRPERLRRTIARAATAPWLDPAVCGPGGWAISAARGHSGFAPWYVRQHQVFGAAGAARLLTREMASGAHVGREPALDLAVADELPDADPVARVTALCLRGYTQNQLLRDIDAVSMAQGLEVRVPLLDHRLVDLALSLPLETKLADRDAAGASYRATGAKRILIDATRDLLPPGLDAQVKRGFGMPFDEWLRGPLRDVLDDTLSGPSLRAHGAIDPREAARVRRAFEAHTVGWAQPWLLMCIELWWRGVLERSGG